MSDDPVERLRVTVHRFVATVRNLQWWATDDETAKELLEAPIWHQDEWDAIPAAAAGSMLNDQAETQLRDAIAAVRDRTIRERPDAVTSVDWRKAQNDARNLVRNARQLVDQAIAKQPSAVERRLAAARVSELSSRTAHFSQHDDYSNEASLVVAVAAFELALGEFVRGFYAAHPEALKGLDRKLTAREIVEAIEAGMDLRERLTDEAVDAVLRRAPDRLRAWFEEQRVLTVNLDRSAPTGWATVKEILERRHTIVHAGSVVTPRYASEVDGSPPVGSSLRITGTYMEQAIPELLGLGVTLGVDVWRSLFPNRALDALVTAENLLSPIQCWGDRSTDTWASVGVVVGSIERLGESPIGPDAEGIRVVARLTRLWWESNERATHDSTPPAETIAAWAPGESVVEQFAIASLRHDQAAAAALFEAASESPAFALLILLPSSMRSRVTDTARGLASG